jgi:ribosomal protein S18 acetylase RimI-like enzyme
LLRKLPEYELVGRTFAIRRAKEGDIDGIIKVYQKAFAEPPWNETWNDKQVLESMLFNLSARKPIMLVAESENKIIGLTWGCGIPIEKFPFLANRIALESTSYVAEVAVDGNYRKEGVGKSLTRGYMKLASRDGIQKIVLRTDKSNIAAMALYYSLGFQEMTNQTNEQILDPEYPSRVYLSVNIG